MPAVAFKPSHYTRGKDGAPSEVFPPLSADADKGDQDAVVLALHRGGDASVVIGWRASDQANADTLFDAAGTLNCNNGQRGGFIWPQPVVYDRQQITSPTNGCNPQPVDPSFPLHTSGAPLLVAPDWPADPTTAHEGKTYTHEGNVFRTRNVTPALFHPEVPEVCGTIADGAHHGGGLNGQDAHTGRILPVIESVAQEVDASCASLAVRRLTPRECERLQGFPDDYTLIEYRGKPAADGNRYKALGNSMAVNVMRLIGERIDLIESKMLAVALPRAVPR